MNTFFAAPREKFITAGFDWPSRTIRLDAWRGDYVFDEAHASSEDIVAAGGQFVAAGLELTGKAVQPGGYAMSNPALLPAVPAGAPVTFLVMMDDDTPLLLITSAEGLPFTPNGLDQIVSPDWLAMRGWFRA